MSEKKAGTLDSNDRRRACPDRARRPRSDAEWLELFEAWRESGLSINAFAQREGITPSVFYRARKRLRRKGLDLDSLAGDGVDNHSDASQARRDLTPAGSSSNDCSSKSSGTAVAENDSRSRRSVTPAKENPARDSPPTSAEFIELRVAPSPNADRGSAYPLESEAPDFSGVQLVQRDGTRVVLSSGFDATTLARALETIRALDPQSPHPSTSSHHAASASQSERAEGGASC